jgi:ABC-type cobalt transport system substrate-binding protein
MKSFELRSAKLMTVFIVALALSVLASPALASKWPGVDETVVEKYAEQSGRPPSEPLINTDQGDILLFVFLLAGVAGGFVLGYYWREFFGGHKDSSHKDSSRRRHLVKDDTDGAR